MRNDKANLIVDKTFNFALEIVAYTEKLKAEKHFEIASQLFRSGTSIGANVWEAQNAESAADFIHKFKIGAKEADETNFWLQLCERSEHYSNPSDSLKIELQNIIRII